MNFYVYIQTLSKFKQQISWDLPHSIMAVFTFDEAELLFTHLNKKFTYLFK